MGMAYDAARREVVLFGGYDRTNLNDTWTWNGSDWTRETPSHSPPARWGMGMVYDAARGQVVMFGGFSYEYLADTWTWDGSDWTQRSPAHSPSMRAAPGLAYDAAQGQVVLFGGHGLDALGDTWTWDGTDWTLRSPAHVPPPRESMGMSYDSAHGQVLMFGGAVWVAPFHWFMDTWTWDGSDWTQQSPGHSPSARERVGLTDDPAHGEVLLFGGLKPGASGELNDTWTWDGTDWSQLAPPLSPTIRSGAGIAFDGDLAQVVLYGGRTGSTNSYLGDTWKWNGAAWSQRPAAAMTLTPASGPPETVVQVRVWGFLGDEPVRIWLVDSTLGKVLLKKFKTDPTGAFLRKITIPPTATAGKQRVVARGTKSGETVRRPFVVS